MDKIQLLRDTIVHLNLDHTHEPITYRDIFSLAFSRSNRKSYAKAMMETWEDGGRLHETVVDFCIDILTDRMIPKLTPRKAVKRETKTS